MSSARPIKKAIFPVAGLGTRFLPATKATPKEMMPIVDKPLIQYAVEEALSIGITELIFITSSSKRTIEDHFDTNFELEMRLQEQSRLELLDHVRNIMPDYAHCIYIRQPNPHGLGHAVLCGESIVGDEPFAVLLADDLIEHNDPKQHCLKNMALLFHDYQSSIIAVEQIPDQEIHKYGIVDILDHSSNENAFPIKGLVEKPSLNEAPSTFGSIGRYILTSRIFHFLKTIPRGKNNELQLADAIHMLCQQEQVFAYLFQNQRFDCGHKLGYMKACITHGLKHPEIGEQLAEFIQNLLQETKTR